MVNLTNMTFYDENNKKINNVALEAEEQKLALIYVEENDVVLELGARYGSVSCAINSKLKNKTNQVSVEPDERVWQALENNKKNNNCEFNIIKGFISNVKLGLTNKQVCYNGYGTTSIKDDNSNIPSYSLEQIMETYNLKFNVLIADCEGFLEQFINENPKFCENLRLIIFEADYPDKCNYNKVRKYFESIGFIKIKGDYQNVYLRK